MTTKLAYSIPELADAIGQSVSSIRAAIDKGDLPAKYPNRKPIITLDAAMKWIESLPDEAPRKAS